MEIVLCVLMVCSIICSVVAIIVAKKSKQSVELPQKDKKEIIEGFNNSINVISQSISNVQKISNDSIVEAVKNFQMNLIEKQTSLEETITKDQKRFEESLTKDQRHLEESLVSSEKNLEDRIMKLIEQLDTRMSEMSKMQENKLEQIKNNTQTQIDSMRDDNNKQLNLMRETVDEKLSKTINERFDQSFKVLSTQLENVYKSLGEMQTVATNVDALSKVLSNVKTTGIFGEIQLGAILDQILTKDQYETNVVTGAGREPVEYAIKYPGLQENEYVYMPIDSKFPLTVYRDLYNAYENNQMDVVKSKRELLKNEIKKMAKDIHTKYVLPPKTTDFAVMFLPIEGLYAEVAKMGLIEELQSTYKVTIAGPTTMSALLNSLQMGFRTLAIQKKSGEVWNILGAVKTEFGKINEIVKKIQDRFENTSKDFETLVGTRSRMLASKLKTVDKIDITQSAKLLGMDETDEGDEEE